MEATRGSLKVHSENILPIIKCWLYSDKDIFVRELVSNATDAISKRKLISENEGISWDSSESRIDVVVDKENRRIEFRDNGLGMTAEELEPHLRTFGERANILKD